MSADFTPSLNTYTDLTPFRFWCQKILPIAYDDSLSYYELLCKVVDYLNKTMEDVELSIEDVEKLHDAYDELQTYVNTYFANLDVQEEINNKLDALVADGTIHDIFNDDVMAILTQAQAATQQAINNIPNVVGTWLGQHVTPETGYVIDDSLSTKNAAADALATGVADSNIKSAVELAFFGEIEDDDFVQGYRTQADYYTVHNQTTRCSSAKYYHVYPGDTITISNIADGTKSAILGAGKTSATNYDSGWKTADFTYTAVNELIVFIETAKSDDTADILVSDVTTVFTLVDKSTRITDNENAIGELKSDFTDVMTHKLPLGPFVANSYVKRDGTFVSYNGWKRTDYIDVSDYTSIFVVTTVNTTNNVFYNANKEVVYPFSVDTTEKMWSLPESVKYVVFSNTNQGMDDLEVRFVYRLEEQTNLSLYIGAEKEDANELNNTKGSYSTSGVANTNNQEIHAVLPDNTAYIRNVYNGYFCVGVWDASNTFLGIEYANGFVTSGGSAGTYFHDYANVKKMFDAHSNCTLQILYTSRISETLINKADFNTVYNVYVFPDAVLSADDVIKNTFTGTYCATDIDSKLQEYGNLIKDSGVSDTFLFFTDPHPFYTATGLNTGWKNGLYNKMPLIEKAYNSTGTGFCLCGGDWLGNSDTPEVACAKLGFVSGMMKHFFDKYYMMNGNHDTNYQGTTELTTNALINSMFADFGSMYYHFDTPNAKYYIFDSGKDNNNSMTAYRWQQIDWFATQLIENDDGHNVIGVHIVTNQYQEDFESDPVFQNFVTNITAVADAYNSKGTITLNSVTYNFTNTTGKVDFAIAGHSHFDAITELNNIPIMITTWVRAGSISTFDLVLADYTARTVKTVRIGSGLNRTMSMA